MNLASTSEFVSYIFVCVLLQNPTTGCTIAYDTIRCGIMVDSGRFKHMFSCKANAVTKSKLEGHANPGGKIKPIII